MTTRCLLVGLALGAAACPAPELPAAAIPPVSTGKVRVRVFTEPSPVRMLASAERFVFVATEHDLERFDDGGGVFALTSPTGMSGHQVLALGPDPDRQRVWILSDGGLGHYDTATQVYTAMPDPLAPVGVDFAVIAKEGASVASATDGGAWVGSSGGLIHVGRDGAWAATPIKDPIRAMARDRSGWLWLATPTGLVTRKPTGETVKIDAAYGCSIVEPRLLVELPDETMLVIGADDTGRERLAFGNKLAWTTYRALPEVVWDAATRRGTGAVVMGGGRVYRIGLADTTRVRPLARDGMRLVPLAGGATAPWAIEPIDVIVPPGATSLGASDDQLLIGTRDLGTARFREGSAHPRDWLRRRQMFQDATTLSVACARADDCWIATGARQAWHWTGERFTAGGPDQIVAAVVRDPAGAIFALHRADGDASLHLSRIDRTAWTPVGNIAISTPGPTELSFARFGATGSLWLGLRYREGAEVRSYGVAIVDTATGKVAYHRNEPTSGDESKGKPGERSADRSGDRRTKMLPVPIGAIDADVRGDSAWFATAEGVVHLAGGKAELWDEAEGLTSERARAITIAADGRVFVATGAGTEVWDGKRWDSPAALRFLVNDLVATRNGQVWMATERGIAAWDGTKVRRVDTRRGLAENQILDVAVDQLDRVWARGSGSLMLISQ